MVGHNGHLIQREMLKKKIGSAWYILLLFSFSSVPYTAPREKEIENGFYKKKTKDYNTEQ